MTTSKVTYQGDLRTTAIHLQSNNEIITDAPVDNHSKGEAFSPTDLLATSLASCMLTIIDIRAKARDMAIDVSGTEAKVVKNLWQLNQEGSVRCMQSVLRQLVMFKISFAVSLF